jgi:hypothetical protein
MGASVSAMVLLGFFEAFCVVSFVGVKFYE